MNRKKILLVSDKKLFLGQKETFAKSDHFTLLFACSGLEALETVKNIRPDLIFINATMPDISGADLCSYIMNDVKSFGIPVVMITDAMSTTDLQCLLQSGCDDIIINPVDSHYLLAIAHKFLNPYYRKAPRYLACLAARYGTGPASLSVGKSINISAGGIFIETDDFLTVNTEVSFEFALPNGGANIDCDGRVAWVNHPELCIKPNLPFGMGFQFLGVSLAKKVAINEYIKSEALTPFW